MDFQIVGNPEFGHVDVNLRPGEKLYIESGAMAHMSSHLGLNSRLLGGFLKALIRKLATGESLMVGEYSAEKEGVLSLSPSLPGEVRHLKVGSGPEVFLQGGSFLACSPGVDIATKFGGLRAFFSSEGLFFMKFSGNGDLFFNAYGAIIEHDVDGSFVVDTGHVVGWESTLDWRIKGMGGLKATLLSGEGLVMEFQGKGKLWTQTRAEGGLVSWLSRFCW